MAVWFFYVDESYDTEHFCLSAIAIRHSEWKACFNLVKQHRADLKKTHGIATYKEIHAKDFTKGRGNIAPGKVIGKYERNQIFKGLLNMIASLPQIIIFNVCLKVKGNPDPQMLAWDRLINRIERTMVEFEKELGRRDSMIRWAQSRAADADDEKVVSEIKERLKKYRSRAFIIADEGREREIETALRRMHVHNYIQSRYGAWMPGQAARNITVDRIIEDPVFKSSSRSYFLQLADCVAFSLLKQESTPTPHAKKYGQQKMFNILRNALYTKASTTDPQGIVRR